MTNGWGQQKRHFTVWSAGSGVLQAAGGSSEREGLSVSASEAVNHLEISAFLLSSLFVVLEELCWLDKWAPYLLAACVWRL